MGPAETNEIVRRMRAVRAVHPAGARPGRARARASRSWAGSTARIRPSRPRSRAVAAALASLQRSGAITRSNVSAGLLGLCRGGQLAEEALRHAALRTRRRVANVQAIAAAGGFIPSRLPALFLTLERNRTWWTTGSLLASRVRISFPGSKLVWEYYVRPGDRDPVARHVRRGQRVLLGWPEQQPQAARLRTDPARDQARRRHRVGVHVPVRRR